MTTVGKVARIFRVDRTTIKTWAYKFSKYLSSSPSKGETRYFTQKDLMVLALIAEEYVHSNEPDYGEICSKLEQGKQYDDCYTRIAYAYTPLFQEYPDEDISYHPAYAGFSPMKFLDKDKNEFRMSDHHKRELNLRIASGYRYAGDSLLEEAIKTDYTYELIHPICFNYRHAIEVYLKTLLLPKSYDGHDFLRLVNACKARYKAEFAEWVVDRLTEFDQIDPKSDAFRYADSQSSLHSEEEVVDLRQLRSVVDSLCTGLDKLINKHILYTPNTPINSIIEAIETPVTA
ncbi:MAG TPA: MerR family transcriptional regulator [Coleofasciculaceae cyanobacterium]|jgi:DNA-binding transcriptional MerR regulator